MAYFMGVDAGSRTCKAVVIGLGGSMVVAWHIEPLGTDYGVSLRLLRDQLLAKAGLTSGDIAYVVATGHSTPSPTATNM